MSVSVALNNPRSFSQEAMTLLLGGGISGLVVFGLNLIAGTPVPQLSALSFGAVLGLLANLSDSRAGTPMLRLVLAILGGGAMAVLLPVHWAAAGAAGGLLLGLAFSLQDGDSAVERGFFMALYAMLLAGGVFTTSVLGSLFDVALLANLFEGLTWGVFLALAAGFKQLSFSRDPIRSEFNDAAAELDFGEKDAVEAGRALYEQIVQEFDRIGDGDVRDRAEEIARETSRALIALCRRARELRQAAERTRQRQLEQRIVELDDRIQNTNDETVRRELSATLDELVEQVRVRRRFDVARARLEARQQRCFTALERLHVSLIQNSAGTTDASVQESIEGLEKLSEEIHWRNLSVDELVADDESHVDSDAEAETILEELRAEIDVSEATDDLDEEEPTVLDSESVTEDASDAEVPDGTDGTLEVAEEEEEAHAHHGSSR